LLGGYIDKIIKDCDKDHDGEINYREFLESLGITEIRVKAQMELS